MPGDAVTVVLLYPELLGTYGDGGNALVLAQRLRWRGRRADIVEVTAGEPVPESGQIYLMGGGEDGPQALAARELIASRALHRAVEGGAALLAVCAGFQVVGRRFVGPDGEPHAGRTRLGPGCQPLGRVVSGHGNNGDDGGEGGVSGRVVGTYLHGPVLARNPALADHLLASVVGDLEPLDDAEAEVLRKERLAAARRERR